MSYNHEYILIRKNQSSDGLGAKMIEEAKKASESSGPAKVSEELLATIAEQSKNKDTVISSFAKRVKRG